MSSWLQRRAFKAGYRWAGDEEVQNTSSYGLTFERDQIFYCRTKEIFDGSCYGCTEFSHDEALQFFDDKAASLEPKPIKLKLKSFKVRTENHAIFRLLQINAFKAKYEWSGSGPLGTLRANLPYGMTVYAKETFSHLHHKMYKCNDAEHFSGSEAKTELSVIEAIKFFTEEVIENAKPKDPVITIATNPVKFIDHGSIKFGSTTVPFEDLEKMYNHAKNMQKQG